MSDLRQVLKEALGFGTANKIKDTGKKKGRKGKQVRKMIVMRNTHCYNHCLQELRALGVRPAKKVAGAHAVVCRFPAKSSIKALQAHAMVKRVEPDVKMKLHVLPRTGRKVRISAPCASIDSKQIIPWGVSRVGASKVWSKYRGGAVRVAVLDTGVSDHPDLRIVQRYNTIEGTPSHDENGHGTHVSGTVCALDNAFGVIGVAPRASLYAVKAFDASGSAYTSDIVQGLDWCIRNNIRVINMSFGMSEESATVKELLQRAYKKGIVLVASAGNSGPNTTQIDFPARLPQVIAVAASTEANGIANFSNRGPGIAVAAPGENICSTIPGKKYGRMSGTSMAAPHVTGAVALLLSKNRRLSPSRVRQVIRSTAKPLPGYTANDQGAGLLQVNKAIAKV
ncbi:MAG: peptidase [Paenibacillaceae bacterium]|nr:peptidase [Paenibacillaceae bacterium]